MYDILIKTLYGMASGAVVAFMGYAKSFTPEGCHEEVNIKKGMKTIIIGTIVGGVSGATGLSTVSVEANIASYGLVTYVIDSGINYIYKKFFKVYPAVVET